MMNVTMALRVTAFAMIAGLACASAEAAPEKTTVTVKGIKHGADFDITLTAKSSCHALMLARLYDKNGTLIFPQDEAAGEMADENEEYKATTTIFGRDPFPVVVDLKEAGGSRHCDPAERAEKPDYHRHGPFLATGAPAKYRGVTPSTPDPNHAINKDAFRTGPGKYKE